MLLAQSSIKGHVLKVAGLLAAWVTNDRVEQVTPPLAHLPHLELLCARYVNFCCVKFLSSSVYFLQELVLP